ncbi:MAG: S4 domain-containing protein [Candidatus Helarchaeota archaeon]
MVRLDLFLTEKGLIITRSRAKRAILAGFVRVNGKIIRKPAYSINPTDHVELLSDLATKPAGYLKLHTITHKLQFPLFFPSANVLDLGSSAGGFLEYAAERCHHVIGVEFAPKFLPYLHDLAQQYPNITIIHADAFTLDLSLLPESQFDLILNDLTLSPPDTCQVLEKYLPLLHPHGYLLTGLKYGSHPPSHCFQYFLRFCTTHHLQLKRCLELDKKKKEFYVVAFNCSNYE